MSPIIIILISFLIIAAVFYVYLHTSKREEPANASPAPPTSQLAKKYHPVYLARLAEVKRQAEALGDAATVHSILTMTYNGPLPTMKPDGTFTDLRSSILSYNIAGINFRKGLRKYVGEFTGYLQPEPSNRYDPNAIAVHHFDGHHLGYIHADHTDEVRSINLPFPIPIWGEIEEDFDYDDRRRYYRGIIFIEVSPKVYPSKTQL